MTELGVTGVSLALLCHGAAEGPVEPPGPAAPGSEAAPERARRDPAGEADATNAARAPRGDGGGGSEAGGRPAEPARHELLRQWGFTAVLHIVPGGHAGGAGGAAADSARAGRSSKGGGGAGRAPPPPKGPHAAANGAGHMPEHAARANGRLDALPDDALREQPGGGNDGDGVGYDRDGAGDDGDGCGARRAAAGAGRTRAQVRVDVQLRALVPVVSAAGAAAALRMATRAERCARFWAHWRRRPSAAVAAAPAAWWRHAVGAARAACREVGRRPPVPLGALPARRARRLAYQARPAGRARQAFFCAARSDGRTGGRSHAWPRGVAQVPLAAAALSCLFT